MPASVSPLPPVLRPGLPVVLMKWGPAGRGDERARALEDERDAVRLDEAARDRVALVGGKLAADETRHFADVRRDHERAARLLEERGIFRQQVEAVGVDDRGQAGGQRAAQHFSPTRRWYQGPGRRRARWRP